jgi:hypothetical protein
VSAQLSEQTFQYFGILNGVTYRFGPSSDGSFKPMAGGQPWQPVERTTVSSDADAAPIAALPVKAEPENALRDVGVSDDAMREQEIVAQAAAAAAEARDQRLARSAALFPRSGGEPLRAGHPDLWALLVAGTCLDGTGYAAG